MSKRLLVINADDFGYCHERNRGILACYKAGGITSASVLVNAFAAADAVRIAKDVDLPIGLHLNLTEGRPVSPKTINSSITNSAGYFLGKHGYRERILSGSYEPNVIKNEIEAQVNLFCQMYGALPVHVDGHQHAHVAPGVCEIFSSVMQQCDIKWTRLPVDQSLDACDWLPEPMMDFLTQVKAEAEDAKLVFNKFGLQYPENFLGVTTMGNAMTSARLQQQLGSVFGYNLPCDYAKVSSSRSIDQENCLSSASTCAGVGGIVSSSVSQDGKVPEVISCELMVHPGFPSIDPACNAGCGTGPDDFSKSPARKHEMDLLMGNDMTSLYRREGYKLCCYCDLSS